MATRALLEIGNAVEQLMTVQTADIAVNLPVKFGSLDGTIILCAADDPLVIGTTRTAAIIGAQAAVVLNGYAITKVELSGTATRGLPLKVTATGYENATLLNAGATLVRCSGQAMQSGVVGDIIGMLVAPIVGVEA